MNLSESQELIVSVLTAIIGLAIVAVILSPKSQTSGVIGAAASGFGQLLSIAVSPITNAGGAPGSSGGFTQPTGGGGGGGFPGGIMNVRPAQLNLPQINVPTIQF